MINFDLSQYVLFLHILGFFISRGPEVYTKHYNTMLLQNFKHLTNAINYFSPPKMLDVNLHNIK